MKPKLNTKKHLKAVILLALLPLCLGLIGCSRVTLYPIVKQDIVRMLKGQPYTSDRDGFFLSDLYMKEVEQAKVERVNLK